MLLGACSRGARGPRTNSPPLSRKAGPRTTHADVVLRVRHDMVMGRARISACKLRTSTDTQGYALLNYDSKVLRIIGSQENEGIFRK